MLINPDGSFIRDIDIEELRITFGEHYGKEIVFTKEKISYRNTVHPTIAYMSFPQGYFDIKETPISVEQFVQMSDAIHYAGLLELFRKPCEHNMYPGAVYQTMHCVFDDGAHYEYMTSRTPDKKFNDIVNVLLPLCDFPQNESIHCQKRTESITNYYETNCCNAVVPSKWNFCPKCGQMLTPSNITETDKIIDIYETVWLCDHCEEGVSLVYQYCGKCGRKRSW
ncbi:MAG: zinc ribbon domain-containing protein [Acutalibacteraceae bacterium]